jgi:hypothetical protein
MSIAKRLEIPVNPTLIFTEKNPMSTAWRAQRAENARAAMYARTNKRHHHHKCPSFVQMEQDVGEWPVV